MESCARPSNQDYTRRLLNLYIRNGRAKIMSNITQSKLDLMNDIGETLKDEFIKQCKGSQNVSFENAELIDFYINIIAAVAVKSTLAVAGGAVNDEDRVYLRDIMVENIIYSIKKNIESTHNEFTNINKIKKKYDA